MVNGDSIGGMLNIFWIFLIISMLVPLIKKKFPDAARLKLIRTMEKKRRSRVITMIHRQEMMAILGFPLFKYIDIEDSEQVLRAIRLTPTNMPLDLILHTPGGLVLAAEEIADTLTTGQWTYDYPITFEHAREPGLPVTIGLPEEVYTLMELYPQPAGRRPSVEYIPVPYRDEKRSGGKGSVW